jgi:hypothetical protein
MAIDEFVSNGQPENLDCPSIPQARFIPGWPNFSRSKTSGIELSEAVF